MLVTPRGRVLGTAAWRASGRTSTSPPAPLVVLGLQPLGSQGDPPRMAAQHGDQVGVIARTLTTGAFEDHVDRHRRRPGLEEGLAEAAVGGAGPGQPADTPGPGWDLGRPVLALRKPVPLLEGGVINGDQHHGFRGRPWTTPLEQLGIEVALPHPQPRPRPTRGDPRPAGRQGGEQQQHPTAAHGASAGLRRNRSRSPGRRAPPGSPAGREWARWADWSAGSSPELPGQGGAA